MTETVFTLLGQSVTGFGLGMAGAMLLMLAVMGGWCHARKLGYGVFVRFAALAVPLTLLCSRALFVLADCTYYLTTLSNPALALRFWDGGYSLVGAVLGFMLAAWLSEKAMRLPGKPLLDGAALALPLGILVERLCEMGTDMGMGKAIATPAFMFLGVEDPLTGEWVHPVFYYEAAVAGILFVVLLICALRRKKTTGSLLGIFTVLFAATQIFFECMRNDNHMVVHFVPVQQVAELLMLLTVLGCWTKRLAKKGTKKSQIMLIWLVVIACVVLTVFMEFRIDRGSMKLLYYSVIALCMAMVSVLALRCRRKAA